MITFQAQPMNISQDNISQNTVNTLDNLNTQENENQLKTVQISQNGDKNVLFYCSTHYFGEITLCLKNFQLLQSIIDYYELLLDTSHTQYKCTKKRKVDELFQLSIARSDA